MQDIAVKRRTSKLIHKCWPTTWTLQLRPRTLLEIFGYTSTKYTIGWDLLSYDCINVPVKHTHRLYGAQYIYCAGLITFRLNTHWNTAGLTCVCPSSCASGCLLTCLHLPPFISSTDSMSRASIAPSGGALLAARDQMDREKNGVDEIAVIERVY